MAPKRRTQTAAQRTSSSQQSKLTFHGKESKVTKPSTAQQIKSAKKDPSLVEDIVQTDAKEEADASDSEKAAQRTDLDESAQDPLADGNDPAKADEVLGGRAQESDVGAVGGTGSGWVADEEEQARKISDTQIKKYWRQKEQERMAPRVHQEDLSVHEKVLREWDMSGQYGVSP